jgi:hypothetical protein
MPQLAELVAENILSCDQKFWLRLATRSDTATSPAEQEQLMGLANRAMMLVDRIVIETEAQLSNSAKVLHSIAQHASLSARTATFTQCRACGIGTSCCWQKHYCSYCHTGAAHTLA